MKEVASVSSSEKDSHPKKNMNNHDIAKTLNENFV